LPTYSVHVCCASNAPQFEEEEQEEEQEEVRTPKRKTAMECKGAGGRARENRRIGRE
jgi:hypothetical protein